MSYWPKEAPRLIECLVHAPWMMEEQHSNAPHSWKCGDSREVTCKDCLTYLCQFSFRDWKRQRYLARRQLVGDRQPHDDSFIRQLEYDLRMNPEVFGPLIQFLNNYKGARP